MPLRGDVAALRAKAKELGGLKNAGKAIAAIAAPKLAARADSSIRMQSTPYGEPWTPSKGGGAVLQGASSQITVRLTGAGKTITVRLLYPLGFHNDGTHVVGRKRAAAIRRKLVGAAVRLAARPYGAASRRKKNETEDEYDARMAHHDVLRSVRQEAREMAKREVTGAIETARAAGGWHDPPRPLIPNDAQGIPPEWRGDLTEATRQVLAKAGATEKSA